MFKQNISNFWTKYIWDKKTATLTLVIGLIFFFKTFFFSFYYGKEIILYGYLFSSFEFIFLFYIFFITTLFAIIQKIYLESLFFHLLFSFALLVSGEFSYTFFLQFFFLFVLFSTQKSLIFIYFLAIHKGLILLFSFSSFLYFIFLGFILYKIQSNLNQNFFLLLIGLLLSYFINIEKFLFPFYVWLDIQDTQNYHINFVFFALSFLHLLLFMIMKKISF